MGEDKRKGGEIRKEDDRVRKEISRLKRIYKGLSKNQFAVAQGLIVQAARLRISLDDLWKDIEQNGTTEKFSQSADAEPYQRERPVAKQFIAMDKNYQALIKQLNDICPPDTKKSKLAKLRDDE